MLNMVALHTSIMVDCGGGWKLRLTAEGATTAFLVKHAVEEAIGIPVERQSLSDGLSILPDGELIHGGVSAVFLTVHPLPAHTSLSIRVTCVYPAYAYYEQELEVKETDTVMELKQQIRASSEFATMLVEQEVHEYHEQVLIEDLELRRTGDLEMEDNDAPLSKYHIHEGCNIRLLIHAIYREVSDSDGARLSF